MGGARSHVERLVFRRKGRFAWTTSLVGSSAKGFAWTKRGADCDEPCVAQRDRGLRESKGLLANREPRFANEKPGIFHVRRGVVFEERGLVREK
jgi:hypothetical protein